MNSKFFFLVYVLIFFLALPCTAQKDGKTFKVVIDAGHGGKDPGCLGAYTKEKDVALNVALKTGKLISDNCPNVKVQTCSSLSIATPTTTMERMVWKHT